MEIGGGGEASAAVDIADGAIAKRFQTPLGVSMATQLSTL
jgi:hypothetical protein